jgi:hypothetical protein
MKDVFASGRGFGGVIFIIPEMVLIVLVRRVRLLQAIGERKIVLN